MKIILKHTLNHEIDFKQIAEFYHGVVTTSLYSTINKDTKRKMYSYKYPIFKQLKKDEQYYLEFVSSEVNILDNFVKNIVTDTRINVLEILEDVPSINSNIIKIENLTYEISEPICSTWKINMNGAKFLNYDKDYGLPLLQELIEYQVYYDYLSSMNIKLPTNCKIANGKEYYSFIENIKIVASRSITIKKGFAPTYDVLVQFKQDHTSSRLVSFMLNNGIGAKNSYGCGYVYSPEINFIGKKHA